LPLQIIFLQGYWSFCQQAKTKGGNMLSLVIRGGVDAFIDYLSAHVITCLFPAFFIAGAIGVFVSRASVMKYFGAQAKKVK